MFRIWSSSEYSNVDGTVSATLTFTSSEIQKELEPWILSDLFLSVGDNDLTLDANAVTTIYEFCPDEAGVYKFTASDANALVGNWGYGSFNIVDKTTDKTSTLEYTITSVGQCVMVGISGADNVTLTIEKISDYHHDVIQWTVYQNTELDKWAGYVIDASTFKAIDVTDRVADVIVKCDDGLYRYGDETGRVVVANLIANPYLSFSAALNSGPLRVAYEDENGVYTTGIEMTDAMQKYCDKGKYYPLTDELIYMLKELGNDKGWFDANKVNGYYLFGDVTVDAETAYLAFCGTVCAHNWVNADCFNAKVCAECGKTEGEALGHSWNDATCSEPKTCSVCGTTEGKALGHSYDKNTHLCVCGEAEPITVKISWNGEMIEGWEFTSDYGTVVSLPTHVAPDGMAFVGYAESEGGQVVTTGEYIFTKNITLYAVFESVAYTVSFAGPGTEYLSPITAAYGDVITLPCRYYDLYIFDGVFVCFNTAEDGSGETWMDCTEYTVTGDVTFYTQSADLAIGDGFLNDGQYMDNSGNVTNTKPNGGYAHLENGTLTLHDFAYSGEGYLFLHNPDYNQHIFAAVYNRAGMLNVVLEGENILNVYGNANYGLRSDEGMSVSGTGSLMVTGGFTSVFSGLDLTVDSGTLNLKNNQYAIYAVDNVALNGGVINTESAEFAVFAEGGYYGPGNITVNGGVLNAKSERYGLSSNGSLVVTGGKILVQAGPEFSAVEAFGTGITLENVNLLLPVNGAIEKAEYGCTSIVDVNGNVAETVVIVQSCEQHVDADGNGYCDDCELKLDVKFQVNVDGTAVRLLTYVGDLADYSKVTFRVTINGKTTDLVCTKAYTSVLANGQKKTASSLFGEDADYLVMYTLTGITEAMYGTEMTVSVIWTTVDGTETVGEARTVSIGELF